MKKTLLLILDGWGNGTQDQASAIAQANTPFIDSLYQQYPHATLRTDGLHVGLPDGQMGNSEVGHMNLGAGRIVYQDLAKINLAIQNNTFAQEAVLQEAFAYAQQNNKNVHLIGLVSDGGVHAHINHLKALINATTHYQLPNVFVHAFTDGRDVDPLSGKKHIQDLQNHLQNTPAQLASVIGRYYAMDRDNRWERVQDAYNLLVNGIGIPTQNATKTIQEYYDNGITDEFLPAISLVDTHQKPLAIIQPNDVVIFFNFRTDRGRQLTQVLSQQDFPTYNMHKLPLHFVTLTNYDDAFKNIQVVFNKDNLQNTLGEVLAAHQKTQLRMAETEKYPHVTFFFSGGKETPFEGEERILCPSPKVATYDLQPEMSAWELTKALTQELPLQKHDFICLNFANGDMVGHTGNMQAAIKACETVDACTQEVVTAALANHYTILLLADHGNCETMQNQDGSPNTAHTTNPVPFILIDKEKIPVTNGVLGDIAPTILELMQVPQPKEMTGTSLIIKNS